MNEHEKNCSSHLGYVCTCSGRRKGDVCPYCRKLNNYCTGDFAGCHEKSLMTSCPLTNSSHEKALVRVVEKDVVVTELDSEHPRDFIQVLCACGKTLSENEVTPLTRT